MIFTKLIKVVASMAIIFLTIMVGMGVIVIVNVKETHIMAIGIMGDMEGMGDMVLEGEATVEMVPLIIIIIAQITTVATITI